MSRNDPIRPRILVLLLAGLIFPAAGIPAAAQNENGIRLIVRGDDMGSTHTANLACIESYTNGIMRSVEVMVPTPWFPEAVRLLKENPGLDVGVHLTLTSEWINLKWRPLTGVPSLTGPYGYFYPMMWPNDDYSDSQALSKAPWKIEEIERELRAQIETARKQIPRISHLSGHMGISSISKEVADLVKRLAIGYGLDLDLSRVRRTGGYQGPQGTPQEKVASFGNMLKSLQPGAYLFIDHPGRDTVEMRGVYHTGYENVAEDREGVTVAWTSDEIKRIIRERGIELISYADLK